MPPPYLFASPFIASTTPSDTPDVWPLADLRIGMVVDLGTAPVDLLPFAAGGSVEIIVRHYYAVRTQDNDHGMIYVSAVDESHNGRVDLKTWNTSLPGSRVIGLVTVPDPPGIRSARGGSG